MLDSIVSVSIQAGTVSPSRKGFGVPAFVTYHTRFPERFRVYSSVAGMLSDGFTVNDPAYLMAAAAFSQNPRPPRVVIGRLGTPATPHTVTLDTAGIVTGQTITGTVVAPDGTETAISVAFTVSAAATATALASAIDAISGIAASAVGSVVTADADTNGPQWFFENFTNCAVLDVTADWGFDTELAALALVADFYAVAVNVNSAANVTDVAAWVAANKRIAAFAPQASDPGDYTATANALRTGDNDRAFSLVRKNGRRQFSEAGWLGDCLPRDPGTETWAYKSITGSTTDAWTETQINTLDTDNSNYYVEIAAVPVTYPGKAHGGEWIDVVRGLDWLEARIQEAVFGALVNAPKIPYTDGGAQVIASQVKGVLLAAEGTPERPGLLEPGSSSVSVPLVADVPSGDRAARHLPNVEFVCRLAGAIHTVTVVGTVNV